MNNFRRRRRRDSYKMSSSKYPVLGMFRSNKHMDVYLSKDSKVLFGIGTDSKELPDNLKNKNNIECSKWLGNMIAKKMKEHNIDRIVVNKSGYKFHGKIAELVKAIKENGIQC